MKKIKNRTAKSEAQYQAQAARSRIEQVIDVIADKKLLEGLKKGLICGFIGGTAVTLLAVWLCS